MTLVQRISGRFIVLLLGACLLNSCQHANRYYKIAGSTYTPYHITVQSSSPEKANALILKQIQRVNHSINNFDSLSIISQVNQNQPVHVDSIFEHAFHVSQKVYRLSDGMFDPSCAPLINLWGFGTSRKDSVNPHIIDSLLTFVGFSKVKLSDQTVKKSDPRTILNFSGVGDGCMCYFIANAFDSVGIQNYLIEVGGEMIMKGVNESGKPWTIGVVKPVDDNFNGQDQLMKQEFHLPGKIGLATSGDYRNYYIKNGKKYAHTINPKTGYPAGQNILSVTVFNTDCMVADGLATAIMATGTEGIKKLVKKMPDLKYFIIYSDKQGKLKTRHSPNIEKYLVK